MPMGIESWLHLEREDVFFALEPALSEILEAPFKVKVEQVLGELSRAKQKIDDMNEWRAHFNQLPWYRRVWMTLRGDV